MPHQSPDTRGEDTGETVIKEIVDETTCYREFHTDDEGYTWNILVRSDGSVSLYATFPGDAVHYVVFDSFDNLPVNPTAQRVITQLAETAEGINALLQIVKNAPVIVKTAGGQPCTTPNYKQKIQVAINDIAKAHDLPIDDSLSMLMSTAAIAVYEASQTEESYGSY